MKTENWLASIVSGFGFALGVGAMMALVVAGLATWNLNRPLDNSDGRNGERSGLIVHTDHLTGCQYLESPAGLMALRRDRNTKPVCGVPGA